MQGITLEMEGMKPPVNAKYGILLNMAYFQAQLQIIAMSVLETVSVKPIKFKAT